MHRLSMKVNNDYENSMSGVFVAHNAAAIFFIADKENVEAKMKKLYDDFLKDSLTEKEAKEDFAEVELRELTNFEFSLINASGGKSFFARDYDNCYMKRYPIGGSVTE